ncbi:MAG TPA: SpoIIE family protein phosphatase [Candidatus Limnocylindria bacterium]|nr:SpoIIE family protein phosphatase [Candidatus Limnocylindria bacterium]
MPPAWLPFEGSLHSATNLNELLKTSTRHCRRLVDCERVRIWVARRGGRRLVARDFPETGDGHPSEMRLARGQGLAGWVFERETALRLGPSDPRPSLGEPVPPFRSALVIPLLRRRKLFAAIECLDRQGREEFSDKDKLRLEAAGEHIALALDNALLYEQTERRALEREVLLEVSKTLSAPLEPDAVIEAILKSLRQVVDYDAAGIYLVNPVTSILGLVSEVGYPEGSDEVFNLLVGVGIVGWVAKTGEPVIVPDVNRDPRYVAARPETRSELAAPLRFEGRTIGVFNLESDLEDAYHEGHAEMLTAFASQAAVAIERARQVREELERRRLEKELAIAREIQASFLPKHPPEVPGFDIAGTSLPHDQVGGDYYDFIPVAEARLGLAIADVSGKGIPASLIMAGFRMSLLAEIRNEFAIRAVMRKVNSLLHESTDRNKFVTAFYGVLDFRNRVLTFSNAGHNPPILLRRGGALEHLHEGGVALGVLADAHYDDRPIVLFTGDVLVMYTDGVSEAESETGEPFGTERIERTIERLAQRTAQEIVDGVVADVLEWAGERGQNDDLTLLVLKVNPR